MYIGDSYLPCCTSSNAVNTKRVQLHGFDNRTNCGVYPDCKVHSSIGIRMLQSGYMPNDFENPSTRRYEAEWSKCEE